MVGEIKIQNIKNVAFILVNKGEIQRFAYIVTLYEIVKLIAGKNILENC